MSNISFSQLQDVFGGNTPVRLSAYYADATPCFTSNVQGIPRAGTTIRASMFRQKTGAPREYPPAAMNADRMTFSNLSYGNGTYAASITSAANGAPRLGFNKAYDGYGLRTSFASLYYYDRPTGWYAGTASNMTTMSGSNYYGEHLTIQLPQKITLTSYDYFSHFEYQERCGNTWVVGGSVNNTDWTLLDVQSNVFWNEQYECKTFRVMGNSNAYDWYRMLVLRVGNSNVTNYRDDWGIGEVKLYGTKTLR
jgi:hypothetical protein